MAESYQMDIFICFQRLFFIVIAVMLVIEAMSAKLLVLTDREAGLRVGMVWATYTFQPLFPQRMQSTGYKVPMQRQRADKTASNQAPSKKRAKDRLQGWYVLEGRLAGDGWGPSKRKTRAHALYQAFGRGLNLFLTFVYSNSWTLPSQCELTQISTLSITSL